VTGDAPVSPYPAAGIGIDTLRDAVAVIRCAAVGDAEGFRAVINHTETGRFLAAQLAVIAVAIALRVGLSGEAFAAMLDEIKIGGTDAILDLPCPERGTGR
jgi:hypothetical protein